MAPTGLAPVSPCGNSGMLHIYTTGPGPHFYGKTEKALFQGLSLCHTGLSVVLWTSAVVESIANHTYMSSPLSTAI